MTPSEVFSFVNLRQAALRAAKGAVRTPAVARFLAELEMEVLLLQKELLSGNWRPLPMHIFQIIDPKPRTIRAAAFRDRVVHHALCMSLEDSFERLADPDSYACRPGKGGQAAVKRTQHLARLYPWYIKLDIRHFFETIPHDKLLFYLDRLLPHAELRSLVRHLLTGGVGTSGYGLPIGNLTSQHFANLYLGAWDRFCRRTLRVSGLVRYMDDMICFGLDKSMLHQWLSEVVLFVRNKLGLDIKSEVTIIAPVRVGIPFLGFRIWPRLIRLDAAHARRFRRRFRYLQDKILNDQISETEASDRGLSVVAWAAQANTLRFRQSFFGRLFKKIG